MDVDLAQVFEFRPLSTHILFGIGTIAQLGERLAAQGWSRALVVTDRGVVKAGITDRVVASLRAAGVDVAVFDEVAPDSGTAICEAATRRLREHGSHVVVGVGGGSALDTAKAAALLATNPGPLAAYEGLGKVEQEPLPLVAIPTTAGTGSEVSLWAVILNDADRRKIGIGSVLLYPKLAVCDPELTLGLPPETTATTGMDALAHAVETYVNNACQPISAALALRAIELIGQHLRTAVTNGRLLGSRYAMLLGATMAGLAMNSTRLGVAHALAMPLGSWHLRVPHGIAVSILLPHVMEFNLVAALPRFVDIARALGEPVEGLSTRAAAERAVEAVRRLARDIGIPEGLRRFGVGEADIPRVCAEAMKSGNIAVNPRLVRQEDLEAICRAAL